MKKIAMIIPYKGKVDLLFNLLDSIYSNDSYDLNFLKIYLADTGSSDNEKKLVKKYINDSELTINLVEYDYYNFAKINNDMVKNHIDKNTDLILLCNNDVQLINDAIGKVVDVYNENKNVGTVGALLLYPDLSIQHAGILTTFEYANIPNFTHLDLKKEYDSSVYKGVRKTWGNTGAFLLTSYNDWKRIGGLNEEYVDCFEDVEYNLTLLNEGKDNLTCLDALCIHKESATRKQAMTKSDVFRIRQFADTDKIRKITSEIKYGLLKKAE